MTDSYRSPSSDQDYGGKGLDGTGGPDRAIWDELSGNPASVHAMAEKVRAHGPAPTPRDPPYWVFVCNPKKWAIDHFLEQRIEHDTWGIRPADRHRFAPGQLGIVRVGVDQRSNAERKGKPKLAAGIYAVCEVESETFPGTGANDQFWSPGSGRAPGWPTVKVRYLRVYSEKPLTIERLRAAKPGISDLLPDGFQAASFPISSADFQARRFATVARVGNSLVDVYHRAGKYTARIRNSLAGT